jgi:hypothetical protein
MEYTERLVLAEDINYLGFRFSLIDPSILLLYYSNWSVCYEEFLEQVLFPIRVCSFLYRVGLFLLFFCSYAVVIFFKLFSRRLLTFSKCFKRRVAVHLDNKMYYTMQVHYYSHSFYIHTLHTPFTFIFPRFLDLFKELKLTSILQTDHGLKLNIDDK